ncbi:integral membrane protein GPR137C [Sminthopsis crassicaudata]|uniref:integral membrane protein GPR137C n=1 Tax=Sminthopsis crassicaudata TaxID=9301 RepID=UPI003D688579
MTKAYSQDDFKGTTVCQSVTVGSVVILLYSSRACYNLVMITLSQDSIESPFNYGWANLSDKNDEEDISKKENAVFGTILFFVRTYTGLVCFSLVLFFRAQKPVQNLAPNDIVNDHNYASRAYFFGNPRWYDSDDLPRLGSSREGSLSNSQGLGWYGTITGSRSNSFIVNPHLNGPTSDSVLLPFAYDNLDMNNHQSLYSTPQNL